MTIITYILHRIDFRKETYFMKSLKVLMLTLFGAMVLASCPQDISSEEPSVTSEEPTSSEDPNGEDLPFADGVFNFAAISYEEKADILHELEKYAVDTFIGGIPLYDSAGNVLYNARLSIPSDVFVPNYGFGVSEAVINYPMTAAQEPIEGYREYYHAWADNDPGTIRYWDDERSTVADMHGLIGAAYYSTKFTDDKTGYEWHTRLATEMPIALNPDDNGFATKWRVPVLTGDDLKYSTLSTVPAVAAFDGQAVVLEDYLTPFKMMIDNNLFRATALGSATSGFVGVRDYLDAKAAEEDPSWDDVGIQINPTENAIEFEFNQIKSPFYAMYNLASHLFTPVPEAFITAIGGIDEYGKPNINSILSLGAYVLEEWQSTKQIVFKKNDRFIEADRYSFKGHKIDMYDTALIAFDEFLSGKLDAVGIPATRLQEFLSDPRRRTTLGDTVFKFQVNATDQERWIELFGENGSVMQTPVANYYQVKPLMSNTNFLNGLYFSIDREALAAKAGRNPAQSFLSDAYMIDPEEGLAFRNTPQGEAVLADRLPETFGYSEEIAKEFFRTAVAEEEAKGTISPGTAANPTKIVITGHYQTETAVTIEGADMKTYFEDTFNDAVTGYELEFQPFATANWYDVYYDSMMTGQFDLALGAISGNVLDPIDFMDVVMSDNRTGFTLSWGPDTGEPTQAVQFRDMAWSFDALQSSAMGQTLVSEGREAVLFTLGNPTVTAGSAAGKWNISLPGTYFVSDDVEIEFLEISLWDDDVEGTVLEFDIDEVVTFNPDGTYEILIEDLEIEAEAERWYIDVIWRAKILGVAGAIQMPYRLLSFPAS
jgi:hypothetical protein